MKKLFGILLVISVLFIYGCCCGGCNYKYTLKADGNTYYTNEIKSVNGCIKFLSNNETPMIICGNCSITENKDYKPEKK